MYILQISNFTDLNKIMLKNKMRQGIQQLYIAIITIWLFFKKGASTQFIQKTLTNVVTFYWMLKTDDNFSGEKNATNERLVTLVIKG